MIFVFRFNFHLLLASDNIIVVETGRIGARLGRWGSVNKRPLEIEDKGAPQRVGFID
jgi:hypothetical protein